MLYLYCDKNQVKLLFQKKTMLGQFENAFYEKTHQLNLTENGQIVHMDFFASATREALTSVSPAAIKEKELNLILPQEAFLYIRAEVPADIANSAVSAFIRDKARAQLPVDLDSCLYDYLINETEKGKQILFYAVSKETVAKYQEAFTLLGLQITSIIPESLAYFKLFEKTLRKDKKEYILYASYDKDEVKTYAFDSYGPLEDKNVVEKVTTTNTVEVILKKIADQYEAQGKKLNRLILSGQQSETIRQDTFTKDVGVWTNPLKRIIPQFYEDYLKLLVTAPNTPLPFLLYDICIGAFIFSIENKQFSLFKKGDIKMKTDSKPSRSKSSGVPRAFPMKEVSLFIGSFALSFVLLFFLMKNPFMSGAKVFALKPTPTIAPTKAPTSTPAPAIDRKDVKVKILNGSGAVGEASKLKAELKDKGYVDIITDNADNFDFKTTEIQVNPDKTGLDTLIKTDLADNVSNPKITKLTTDSAADVVIIFGADFK